MKPKQHIERFVVDLQVDKKYLRSGLEDKLTAFVKTEMLRIIDEACGQLAPADKTVLLDRLEIDLGQIGLEQLRGGDFEILRQEFRRQFEEKLEKALKEQPIKYRETPAKDLETIRQFLERGRLPWQTKDRKKLLSGIIERTVAGQAAALRRLLSSLLKQPPILRRLIQNTSPEQRALLLTIYVPASKTSILERLKDLERQWRKKNPAFDRLPNRRRASRIWEVIFQLLIEQASSTTSEQYPLEVLEKRLIKRLAEEVDSDHKKKSGRSGKKNKDAALPEPKQEEEAKSPGKSKEVEEGESEETGFRKRQTKKERPSEDLREGAPQPLEPEENSFSQSAAEKGQSAGRRKRRYKTESWFIQNAGLAILAPYFSRFFELLHLTEESGFRSEKALQKAIALLQYLALGREDFFEDDLHLNKVLCGVDPEFVFWLEDDLFTEDREAADLLLNAAIANAPILNDMSAAGFRSTFMLREGVLRFAGGKWMLHVEREAYDIVLDRLPWGFQILKTAWMETALYVEW